ncbi:MAG: HDIG domain-containing metalloprotein [Bacillota bacterium]
MQRNEALAEVKRLMVNRNLFKHALAVEAVMQELARHFGADEDRWAMAGLLHDIDYESTKNDPGRHSLESAELVRQLGFDDEIVDAVRAHNEYHGLPRETPMARALYACDPLTGLIVAAALVSPERRLGAIDTAFVLNRFGEKAFARGANRDTIRACSELGLELEAFIALGLKAMQRIAGELGL